MASSTARAPLIVFVESATQGSYRLTIGRPGMCFIEPIEEEDNGMPISYSHMMFRLVKSMSNDSAVVVRRDEEPPITVPPSLLQYTIDQWIQ